MSALTAAFDVKRKDGDLVSTFMGAVKIYKGALVSYRVADGFAYPARSGTSTDIFAGIAYETVDNSAGVAGATRIRLVKQGTYVYPKASAVQTDVGTAMYASDDNNLTATSTNNQKVGVAVELIDSTHLRIRIDTAVN